jgi:hypothetical protein
MDNKEFYSFRRRFQKTQKQMGPSLLVCQRYSLPGKTSRYLGQEDEDMPAV